MIKWSLWDSLPLILRWSKSHQNRWIPHYLKSILKKITIFHRHLNSSLPYIPASCLLIIVGLLGCCLPYLSFELPLCHRVIVTSSLSGIFGLTLLSYIIFFSKDFFFSFFKLFFFLLFFSLFSFLFWLDKFEYVFEV